MLVARDRRIDYKPQVDYIILVFKLFNLVAIKKIAILGPINRVPGPHQ